MGKDLFDFNVAEDLVDSIKGATKKIEEYNTTIRDGFKKLREDFKDEGYDQYEPEMNIAYRSIEDIIVQMDVIAEKIQNYAAELKELG